MHVPAAPNGTGNRDFDPKLPGHDFRQPGADKIATQHFAKTLKAQETQEKTMLEQ